MHSYACNFCWRVGNKAFQMFFEAPNGPRHLRINNVPDVVPKVRGTPLGKMLRHARLQRGHLTFFRTRCPVCGVQPKVAHPTCMLTTLSFGMPHFLETVLGGSIGEGVIHHPVEALLGGRCRISRGARTASSASPSRSRCCWASTSRSCLGIRRARSCPRSGPSSGWGTTTQARGLGRDAGLRGALVAAQRQQVWSSLSLKGSHDVGPKRPSRRERHCHFPFYHSGPWQGVPLIYPLPRLLLCASQACVALAWCFTRPLLAAAEPARAESALVACPLQASSTASTPAQPWASRAPTTTRPP